MTRGLRVLVLVAASCGGGNDSHKTDGGAAADGNGQVGDSGGGTADSGGGTDAPTCTGQALTLGDGTSGACAFDVNVSFDPASVNIALVSTTTRNVVCHTLRETGCAGNGWYWNLSHQIALCDAACMQLTSGGSALQVVVEMGCATNSCGESCTQSTGYCTHATASTCCSGRCDGDSCGSGLWGPCPGAFGCFEGTCQNGYCRCPPGDTQCGASCADVMTDNANCGSCGHACTGGKTCDSGTCMCPSGMTDCNGTCMDLTSDNANCGMCGHMCRVEQTCTSSTCLCPSPQSDCNGACVNTNTDPMNCGACGNACDMATETCTPLINGAYCACNAGLFDCNGTCVDRLTDENNCGTCGHVCPGNKQCNNGSC